MFVFQPISPCSYYKIKGYTNTGPHLFMPPVKYA